LTRNLFPNKTPREQIQLPFACGALSLNCGQVQSESSQSYENTTWQADSLKTLRYFTWKIQKKSYFRDAF